MRNRQGLSHHRHMFASAGHWARIRAPAQLGQGEGALLGCRQVVASCAPWWLISRCQLGGLSDTQRLRRGLFGGIPGGVFPNEWA